MTVASTSTLTRTTLAGVVAAAVVALPLSASPLSASPLTATVSAQDPMTFEPPPMPVIDGDFDAASREDAAVKRGEELLRAVSKAYRDAKTIADVARIEVTTPFGPQTDSMDLFFGTGTDALLRVTGITITSLDGHLFVEIPEFSEEKYISVPIENGNVLAALNGIGDGFSLPLPHLSMRFGKADAPLADLIAGLGAGTLEEMKVAGHRTAENRDELLVSASNGLAVAHINAESRLIDRVRISFAPPDAPPGMSLLLDLAFAPRVGDELPQAIAFEAGDRKRVASIDALMQKLEIGQTAPAFSLNTLDGTTVSLADLRGNVVVLDLWATWCGPCRRGLPLLNEFDTWVKGEGKPVKVFGVNVWEDQEQNAEVRIEKAKAFWTEGKFGFPTLMDVTDAVADAYGPNGIPTTFIICPEGKIAAIHNGFSPDMVEMLKRDVAAAMKPAANSDEKPATGTGSGR